MRSLPVRWLLFPSYVAISALTLVLSGLFLFNLLSQFLYRETEEDVAARAQLVRAALRHEDLSTASAHLDSLVADLAARSEARLTLIRGDGTVVADSHTDAPSLDNHGGRPEVRSALAGKAASQRRFSHTLQQEMIYHALPPIPDPEGSTGSGAIRVAAPLSRVETALAAARNQALVGAAIAAGLASLLGWFVARRFARPMEQMRKAAEHYSRGDLTYRVGRLLSEEGERLSQALNTMAGDLDTRIKDLARRNREQSALFRSMSEGVIAVDQQGQVLTINPAAREMFGVSIATPEGRRLAEVIRHTQLVSFLSWTLDSDDLVESELVLHDEPARYIEAHGAPLVLGDSQRIGAIVVLNDVTRQKRMETERRELVANVSHELRTPVTAIRGYLETLENGAIRDPKEAIRFISIASRQTERLSLLIEDLLQLAKIERDIESEQVELVEQEIEPFLAILAQTFEPLCEGGTTIEVDCPEDLSAPVNGEMLERALSNLVSNALRYGRDGQNIRLTARRDDGWVTISVRDEGEGIPREHLGRLFERFYTVDRARSRQKGGTGLGLSIVKHIARAHRGEVSVQSVLGQGSTFALRLPAGRAQAR